MKSGAVFVIIYDQFTFIGYTLYFIYKKSQSGFCRHLTPDLYVLPYFWTRKRLTILGASLYSGNDYHRLKIFMLISK